MGEQTLLAYFERYVSGHLLILHGHPSSSIHLSSMVHTYKAADSPTKLACFNSGRVARGRKEDEAQLMEQLPPAILVALASHQNIT